MPPSQIPDTDVDLDAIAPEALDRLDQGVIGLDPAGTVVAFSAGNLAAVAKKIAAAMPDAQLVIGADDDRWIEEQLANWIKDNGAEGAEVERGVDRWVMQSLARQTGIACNLDMPPPAALARSIWTSWVSMPRPSAQIGAFGLAGSIAVPDLAIVPMWSMTSWRDIPMPLSDTVSVRAAGS